MTRRVARIFIVLILSTKTFCLPSEPVLSQKVILSHFNLVAEQLQPDLKSKSSLSALPILKLENRNGRDKWFGNDKADHLTVSALLVGFGYYAAREEFQMDELPARRGAVCFSLGFGIAKEIYDWKSKRGTPSFKDLLADLVGIGIGFLMITFGD